MNRIPQFPYVTFFALVLFTVHSALADDWEPLAGNDQIRSFMSGLTVERTTNDGQTLRGEYRADGTGTVFSFGAPVDRTWDVSDDDKLCINVGSERLCYGLEHNLKEPGTYRATAVDGGESATFRVLDSEVGRSAEIQDIDKEVSSEGGAASPSADEIAKELSNPNTAVATLTFKNQFRWFKGDLPNADEQWNYSLLLQPSLPFVRDNGDKVIFRPALPILFDQPVFDSTAGDFGEETGIGDFAFDLVYAPVIDPGTLFAFGVASSVPIATDNLGTDLWSLGPEVFVGKMTKSSVYGIFPNHQWDVTGSGDGQVNNTSVQAFYTHIVGGGWTYGSGPTMNYDWVNSQWTIPVQLNVGKTVIVNGRPWKLGVELNYYVEQPDAFGPEWLLSFNIAPVVKNHLASLLGMSKE